MDRLCDEVLQLILNELDDPTSFSRLSKRFLNFSQDPYVRASYFLARHGKLQALFYAFGRGKLMTEKVVDILISSGAHLSRYLVQLAMHHHFRSYVPFIKTPWVRSMSTTTFVYLLSVATKRYGNIPTGKGEDDGTIFSEFLRESRYPTEQKHVKWEQVRDILEKYKFIPFCNKDPIATQFPLALAIEPRLLPLAVANGFTMDSKYRDFIFRKMFEKPAFPSDNHAEEVIRHVRELNQLDPRMFLTRTVAAEVCMEAKTNESAYKALKKLDESGDLLFELSTLVEELIKLFVNTRYITAATTVASLTQLYTDFPSPDPTARLVLLLGVFINDHTPLSATPIRLKSKLEPLGLLPITKQDIFNVMINPFVEKYQSILEFARIEVGLSQKEIGMLVQDVAVRCLAEGCKGKMLRKLYESFPGVHDVIIPSTLTKFLIDVDNLPSWEDTDSAVSYRAPLCRDYGCTFNPHMARNYAAELREDGAEDGSIVENDNEIEDVVMTEANESNHDGENLITSSSPSGYIQSSSSDSMPELGRIGQDTLSAMIRQDETATRSSRRRFYDVYTSPGDLLGKLRYPADPTPVGNWIKDQFGTRSAITAVFMIHAVLNENSQILNYYFDRSSEHGAKNTSEHVPVTLKHFKLLARLGKAPPWSLFGEIEHGAEFFFSEEDYLTTEQVTKETITRKVKGQTMTKTSKGWRATGKKTGKTRIKAETPPATTLGAPSFSHVFASRPGGPPPVSPVPQNPGSGPSSSSSAASVSLVASFEPPVSKKSGTSPSKGKKRPRRSVASTAKSYVVPDSDDESILEEHKPDSMSLEKSKEVGKKKAESNLQRWIKHLTALQKEELKKHNEKKKRLERVAMCEMRIKLAKNEFIKSLTQNLKNLRKIDQLARKNLYGLDIPDLDYSEGEDDEYVFRVSKRRKVIET